ncbi:toxin Cry1Ac domain D-VI-related protein [Loigolactobacillus jiayinensis]|uniref:Toxin Cry1Ac domain D-VI-related protein n=1 Tax=Loigolactobacillus jiayinensis TaxID=2486016 RepID=A0ABW1RGM5_9LACO|nr:toxin Cry1Ac domain D-VI-related protein [Loigolactobacillus jiayinensis]
MVIMLSFVVLVGLIAVIVGIVKIRKKDQNKKKVKNLIYIGAGLLVLGFIGVNLLSSPPKINISSSSSTIDKNGDASLVVKTNKNAQVKIKDIESSAYDTTYTSVDKQGTLKLVVDHSGKYKVYAKNKYDDATKTINIKSSPYEQAPRRVTQLFTDSSKDKLVAGTTMADINDVNGDISNLSTGNVKTWCLKYLKQAKKLQPILAKKEAAATKKESIKQAKAESQSIAEAESNSKAESESIAKVESESKIESESIAKAISESSVKQAIADSASEAASQSSVAAAQVVTESSAPTDQTQQTVWIAPTSGTKYHFDPSCRGLRNANGNIQSMSLSDAVARGYTKCGFE